MSYAQNTLNIHQKDGTLVSYTFSEKPILTYTETGVHLKTSKVEIDFPMSNLEKLTFSDEVSNAISRVRTEGGNSDTHIYSIDGTLLKSIKNNLNATSFSINDLPEGIYLIKNGKATYKIYKR